MSVRNVSRVSLIFLFLAVLAVGTMALAKGKPGPPDPGGCPDLTIFCPAVYDPVSCDQGTFGNQCEADRACATNCVPVGPGPIVF